MPEHLLHRAQVGAALEQVRRERVPEQVRVDAARARGPPSPRGGAGSGRRRRGSGRRRARSGTAPAGGACRDTAGRVRGSGAAPRRRDVRPGRSVPCRPCRRTARAARRGRRRSCRGRPPPDAQAGAVEQLDEGAVAKIARRRPDRGRRSGARPRRRRASRQRARPARQRQRGGRVVRRARRAAGGGGRSVRAAAVRRAIVVPASPSARSSAMQRSRSSIVGLGERLAEGGAQRVQVAAVGLDGRRGRSAPRAARGTRRGQDRGWAWS